MNKPFCTYLIFYSGNKLPPFYIGSTSVEKLKRGYMGTICSKQYKKIWKNELNENRQLFKVKIISLHDTRKDALSKEEILQKKLNVIVSPLYVNMAIANKHFVNYSSPMRGLKHTEETRRKLSELARNRKVSPETRKKLSEIRKGKKLKKPRSFEYRQKSSISHKKLYENGYVNPRTGTKHTEETRKKLSTKKSSYNQICRWYNNGIENKFTHINPGIGWKLGRIIRKASTKGYKWYNDGEKNKMFSHPPADMTWKIGLIRNKT